MFDNIRGTLYGQGTGQPYGEDQYVLANKDDDEDNDAIVNFTPVGFSVNNSGYNVNYSGDTYIYMAIRRPHKPPTAASEVFALNTRSGNETAITVTAGFPVDLAWRKTHTDTEYWNMTSRRYGEFFQYHGYSNAQTTAAPYSGHQSSDHVWDSHAGWGKDFNSNHMSWMWKHNPGMNSTITNYGTGSAMDIYHGL